MIQMTITYGSTTIDLQASGRAVLDGYFPEAGDGSGEAVTDRVDVWVSGTTAELQTSLRAINTAFQYARDHPSGSAGCWLNYAVNGTESTWRSRILNGAAMHDGRLDARWRQGKLRIALAIERLPYWEGAETAIPLTNGNGTDVTTGLTVFNCNDGTGSSPNKRNNYADIAAAVILGDLPAPLLLKVTNTYATNSLYDLWVGHNYTDPANALWNLEAEAADGETGDADAGSSGTQDVSKTLSTDSETTLFTWTLSAAMLSAARGQWVHALPRFSYAATLTNIRFRFKLQWNVTTLWQSDQVLPSTARTSAIRDLCSFRLPPWLQDLAAQDALSLVMTGQRIVATNQLLTLDFLMLVPADSFRYLTCNGYGVATNSRIIDDGIAGDLYRDNGAGAERVGILSGYGEPILLQPGIAQRLYFLTHSDAIYTAETARTISVIASYRPRRSTV